MNGIPAYCDHCKKTVTAPNFFGGPGSANITYENSGVSCPHCGQIARILDGTYSYRAEVIELLSGPKATVERLRELERILKDANKNNSSSEEIAQTIKKELPEFSLFADWLKQHGPTIGSAIFAAMLAAIVQLYAHFDNKQTALKTAAAAKQSPPQVIYQTINNTIINNIKSANNSSSYLRPKQFRKKKAHKSKKNN